MVHTAMQNSVIQNICWKISCDVKTDEKDIYSAHTENPKES